MVVLEAITWQWLWIFSIIILCVPVRVIWFPSSKWINCQTAILSCWILVKSTVVFTQTRTRDKYKNTPYVTSSATCFLLLPNISTHHPQGCVSCLCLSWPRLWRKWRRPFAATAKSWSRLWPCETNWTMKRRYFDFYLLNCVASALPQQGDKPHPCLLSLWKAKNQSKNDQQHSAASKVIISQTIPP